jgi:hypothetical protein
MLNEKIFLSQKLYHFGEIIYSCNDICTQIPETIYTLMDIRVNWVVSVLEEPECRGTMELVKSGIN